MATLTQHPHFDLTSGFPTPGMMARLLTVLGGMWLFISAMLWTTGSPRVFTLVTGLLCAVSGVAALWFDLARFVASLFSTWVVFLAVLMARPVGVAFWNDVVTATLLLGLSLVPSETEWQRPPPRSASPMV